MKKVLLASSAIIGASLLAAPASAGTVGAADKMSVTVSGIYWFQVSFLSEDQSDGHGRGYSFKAPEAELHINAENTADNGITYGVTLEFEAGTDSGNNTDEAYAHIGSDSWGLVQLGDNDGAKNQMTIGSFQTNKSAGGTLGGLAALAPVFHAQHPALLVRTDYESTGTYTSDATKINYFTPRFAGFQLGASLTPDTGQNGASFTERDDDASDYGNVISAGVNYVGDFGDVGVQLGLTGEFGEAEGGTQEDLETWTVGAKVDFAGFEVGADYRDNGDTGQTAAQAAAGGDGGSWWSLGVGYSMGPWGISGHYALGEADRVTGNEESVQRYGVGVGYSVAPGWRVTADLMRIEHENDGGVLGDDNDSDAFFVTNFFSF